MNAKELRLAAEHFKNRSYEESHEGYDEFCKDRVAILSHGVDHILATVHADDDEPVTREWLEELGAYELDPDGFHIGWSDDIGWRLSWGHGTYGGWSIYGNDISEEMTRGQLRHLLAGLGMEVRK